MDLEGDTDRDRPTWTRGKIEAEGQKRVWQDVVNQVEVLKYCREIKLTLQNIDFAKEVWYRLL